MMQRDAGVGERSGSVAHHPVADGRVDGVGLVTTRSGRVEHTADARDEHLQRWELRHDLVQTGFLWYKSIFWQPRKLDWHTNTEYNTRIVKIFFFYKNLIIIIIIIFIYIAP